MNFVTVESTSDAIAQITFSRPPVNAINAEAISQLGNAIDQAVADDQARAIILTGQDAFFSFGLDVPEIFPLSPEEFTDFLRQFTGLYRKIFASPKPIIAALNGHATAGGCMLAIACDHRVMAQGKAKIGLNEVRFGAGLFAGSSIMLERIVGGKTADTIAQLGAFYSADEAKMIGLVDVACAADDVLPRSFDIAQEYLTSKPAALRQIRQTTKAATLCAIEAAEEESLRTFVEIWYSPETRKQVEKIVIRET